MWWAPDLVAFSTCRSRLAVSGESLDEVLPWMALVPLVLPATRRRCHEAPRRAVRPDHRIPSLGLHEVETLTFYHDHAKDLCIASTGSPIPFDHGPIYATGASSEQQQGADHPRPRPPIHAHYMPFPS